MVAILRAKEPPPLGTPGDLVVRVLGPIEVSGWQPPAQRRQQTEALCVYLALRIERPRGTEELLSGLRSLEDPRGEGSPKTLRNTLSLLRQAVGPDRFPDAASSGGYQLRRVVTDRDRFSDLARAGRADGSGEGDLLLAEALAHVRGAPFAGVTPAHYAWAFDGPDASDMTVAIVEVAHELSTRRLDVGDLEGATLAAKTGLRASRSEFVLWGDLVAVAWAGGDPSMLRRVLADAARVLGADEATRLGAGAPHLDPSVR